ncbi:MAG: maleylpyruvate isomerase N-terminal domain-containing protein [Actinomycetota bacterium]
MTAIAERFRRRADSFEALIAVTPPERWASPSPCEGWVARDIVAHIVGFFGETLRDKAGIAPASSRRIVDDPASAFRGIREAVQRVLDDPATPADVAKYLDSALSFDLVQHWWDLAKATGQDATMDPEEVDLLWVTLAPMTADWWKWQVDNGHYAPAVPVPEDAPIQDRVLGLIGRKASWAPPS